MKRSTTQVMFRHLPQSVFQHEDGFFAKVERVQGGTVQVNLPVLLEQLATELQYWAPEQRSLPDPRTNPDEYTIVRPDLVYWDVYPLTFECKNPACGRIRRFNNQREVVTQTNAAGRLRCEHCGHRVRQLRYLTAHNCGNMRPLFTQDCSFCGRVEDMTFNDTGAFRTAQWRCRHCGGTISTRQTPCNCGRYATPGRPPMQRGYTARDQALWYPQQLNLLNISVQEYVNLQAHPDRGPIAIASYLGDQTNINQAMADLGVTDTGARMTQAEWDAEEARLRTMGLDGRTIENLRTLQGPLTTGPRAVAADVSDAVVELGGQLTMVERAGVFDLNVIRDRKTHADVVAAAPPGAAAAAAAAASTRMTQLGIEDISVTQMLPIVIASYGFSRSARDKGAADLNPYPSQHHGGKNPVYAVAAETEAILVTFAASAVLRFCAHLGLYTLPVPADERAAKIAMLEVLAADREPSAMSLAGEIRRLVHSASHALVRALDDGQTGFGESSLAEWFVPDALTTAVYVSSYNDFTLGVFDTVLQRRVAPWLERAVDSIDWCDNDPMCSQTSAHRRFASCDRCLQLTFGCRTWNADLDRKRLREFWLFTRQNTP